MRRQNLLNPIKEEKDNILKDKIYNKVALFLLISFFIFISCVSSFSTANALTISKEKELANKYMKALENTNRIIKDPIISSLVKNVGNEIFSTLPPQPFEFSFYVFDADNFNAFAAPGANIFINTGLITSLDTIDELAGIIAHESAHAASRHIAQLIDTSKIVNIATLAGIIAGALINSKTDSDLGEAITMGSLAAGQSAMLSYTRDHEKEADQKGFNYLTKTHFKTTGLLSSLKKIREADYYGSEAIPDYLKTHPGTNKRIAFLETMQERYNLESKPDTGSAKAGQYKDYHFDLIKYRIIGLYKKPGQANKIFAQLLKKDPDNAAYNYGFALALTKQLKFSKANIHLKKALSVKPFNPLILLEISNIYLHNGEPQKAINILEEIKSNLIVRLSVLYTLGQAQLELGNYKDAKLNLEKVISEPGAGLPKSYYYIAKIYSKEKNPSLTHYFLGHYYFEIKNYKNARTHLEKSIEDLSDEQKIKKAKSMLKEIKKNTLL